MNMNFHLSESGDLFYLLCALSGVFGYGEVLSPLAKHYISKFGTPSEEDTVLLTHFSHACRYSLERMAEKAVAAQGTPAALYEIGRGVKTDWFDKNDVEAVEAAMTHFAPSSQVLYAPFKEGTEALIQELKRKSLDPRFRQATDDLFGDVGVFYGVDEGWMRHLTGGTVDIYVLTNPNGVWSLGMNRYGQNKPIVLFPFLSRPLLALQGLTPMYVNTNILIHEKGHDIEEDARSKFAKYREIIDYDEGEEELLREAIYQSLVGGGGIASVKRRFVRESLFNEEMRVLRNLSLPNESDPLWGHALLQRLKAEIMKYTKEWLEAGKSIFEGDYLQKAYDELRYLRALSKDNVHSGYVDIQTLYPAL
ncbi:hypothetical protein COY95_02670 [Candidatus Woesearchaeota archaeon CG_4_10_14_0_8_um_filter_47_5]|nr:MAG: hypothetical protein COY95_02670 [Candidatus Woesearchaeota archaeon CG_4_10_14_0_8_um_filter_47_5]